MKFRVKAVALVVAVAMLLTGCTGGEIFLQGREKLTDQGFDMAYLLWTGQRTVYFSLDQGTQTTFLVETLRGDLEFWLYDNTGADGIDFTPQEENLVAQSTQPMTSATWHQYLPLGEYVLVLEAQGHSGSFQILF